VSETLKNVVDLEPKPGSTERERSNTIGLEVVVDLEVVSAMVYGLRTPALAVSMSHERRRGSRASCRYNAIGIRPILVVG
jgi:hypothetical protein